MYIIREVFIAKPGHAGELARLMKKEMAEEWKDFKGYVLLDMATDYNKIVIEYEMESLATLEKMFEDMKAKQSKGQSKTPPKYTELYQTGKREIYRVVE